MNARRIWKVVFALLIIAGLAFAGVVVYQAGFAHGAMAGLSLPESAEYPEMSFGHMPYSYGMGPRLGLLGLFPLLCFGGFAFLFLIGWLSVFAWRRAWMRCGPEPYPHHWKSHGSPPPWWNLEKPPGSEDLSQNESNIPSGETEETQ